MASDHRLRGLPAEDPGLSPAASSRHPLAWAPLLGVGVLCSGIAAGVWKHAGIDAARFCVPFVIAKTAVSAGLWAARGRRPIADRASRPFLAFAGGSAVLNGLAWIAYFIAFERGPLAIVQTVTSTYTAVAAVLALIFLRERLARAQALGVAIVVVATLGISARVRRGGVSRGGSTAAGSRRASPRPALWGANAVTARARLPPPGSGRPPVLRGPRARPRGDDPAVRRVARAGPRGGREPRPRHARRRAPLHGRRPRHLRGHRPRPGLGREPARRPLPPSPPSPTPRAGARGSTRIASPGSGSRWRCRASSSWSAPTTLRDPPRAGLHDKGGSRTPSDDRKQGHARDQAARRGREERLLPRPHVRCLPDGHARRSTSAIHWVNLYLNGSFTVWTTPTRGRSTNG